VLGVVMYVLGPLGLSGASTNPWLSGSEHAPLLMLSWLLLLCGPIAAAIIADRRATGSSGAVPPPAARARQVVAAGLLTSMLGPLIVMVFGTGTIAAMLKASWLRNWLYHGPRYLFGVDRLRGLLGGPASVAYSHQITAAVDAPPYLAVCIVFPLVALAATGFIALLIRTSTAPDHGDQHRGGGPDDQEPPWDPHDGDQPADRVDDDVLISSC
jgi:hypothetical protein